MLGVVAMAGLRPWATSTVVPNLSLAPGIDLALGDSTVVARAGSPGDGTGGIAAPRSTATVSAPTAVSTPAPRASRPAPAASPGPAQGVGEAVPVSAPPVAKPAPSPEPVAAAPAPVPAATPAPAPAPPLATTVQPGAPGSAGGPVTSGVGGGVPEQDCEGDEYFITVTFEEVEEKDYELAEADIVVRQLGGDGSETEVQLRGDLTDVRSLVATLVSEGNCVRVDVVPPEGGPVEDGSEAAPDVAEPGDAAESALP